MVMSKVVEKMEAAVNDNCRVFSSIQLLPVIVDAHRNCASSPPPPPPFHGGGPFS
jgi:hypothetical protein